MAPQTQWPHLRTSFQFKLFSIFSLLTFLTTGLLCILYIVSDNNKTRSHAAKQLQLQVNHLADSVRLPLYAENSDMLRQLAEQAARTPEIRSVMIKNNAGKVLADIRSAAISDSTVTIARTAEVHSSLLVESVESSMAGSRDPSTALIGSVHMERGTADLSRALRHKIMLSVSAAFIFWLSVSLLCYLVLRRVARSFNSLMHGIDVLQGGDFTARIVVESNDEPGRAARAINSLAETLQLRTEENNRLQEERLDLEREMLRTQKLESLGIMAGGIAHDFNNLLQAILGNMELASMKLDADSAPQKFIGKAVNTARRAALLTGLMLTYVGQGVFSKTGLNLNTLIRENADMLKITASASVSLELQLAAELPIILADEAHIQQVVMNLITNAAESIEKQPGLIRLTTGIQVCDQTCLAASLLEVKPEPGRYVFLEVVDNGCGMSEETLSRLFDPFFTTKFTGRGLGMSAVIGIMKTHNGALFVESERGRGTTFRALFPIPESVPAIMDQSHPHPGQPLEWTRGQRSGTKPAPDTSTSPESLLSGVALVVDDEKSVLRVCTKMVKLCGFTVITACDGVEAVAKFREHLDEIVVVLMDLTMPAMDGITAMSEIYCIKPDTKIIISSGFNEDELSERITSQPPSGFIRKPYSMSELEAELHRVVRGE